jgi:hypothetical protein
MTDRQTDEMCRRQRELFAAAKLARANGREAEARRLEERAAAVVGFYG